MPSTSRGRWPTACVRARSTSLSARSTSSAPGKAAARPDRARRYRLAHLLGTARRRQDHAGQDHRPHDSRRLHRVLRRAHRHQGNQAGDGRRRARPPVRHPHHRLRRRSPPLQQSAAGRLPALRREGQHPPDRRDHRESVVRDHLRAALALPRLRAEAADRRADCRPAASARLHDSERGLGDLHLEADDGALRKIAAYSSGDARSAYNALEVAATLAREQAGKGNGRASPTPSSPTRCRSAC